MRCGQIRDSPPDPSGGAYRALRLLIDVFQMQFHFLLGLSKRFPISVMVWRHLIESVQQQWVSVGQRKVQMEKQLANVCSASVAQCSPNDNCIRERDLCLDIKTNSLSFFCRLLSVKNE